LRWHPATGRCGNVHGLVHEFSAGHGIAQAQSSQREVTADNASLNGISWPAQPQQGPFQLFMSELRPA